MSRIVAAGDTFCWDTGTTSEQARAMWLHEPPGATLVAVDSAGTILGTGELHPNHGGGGAHVANAGFMVSPDHGRRGVGRALAAHILDRARAYGYPAMQFNAVVATNTGAIELWRSLGFEVLATVPDGFRHPTQGYVGLHIMYRRLLQERPATRRRPALARNFLSQRAGGHIVCCDVMITLRACAFPAGRTK